MSNDTSDNHDSLDTPADTPYNGSSEQQNYLSGPESSNSFERSFFNLFGGEFLAPNSFHSPPSPHIRNRRRGLFSQPHQSQPQPDLMSLFNTSLNTAQQITDAQHIGNAQMSSQNDFNTTFPATDHNYVPPLDMPDTLSGGFSALNNFDYFEPPNTAPSALWGAGPHDTSPVGHSFAEAMPTHTDPPSYIGQQTFIPASDTHNAPDQHSYFPPPRTPFRRSQSEVRPRPAHRGQTGQSTYADGNAAGGSELISRHSSLRDRPGNPYPRSPFSGGPIRGVPSQSRSSSIRGRSPYSHVLSSSSSEVAGSPWSTASEMSHWGESSATSDASSSQAYSPAATRQTVGTPAMYKAATERRTKEGVFLCERQGCTATFTTVFARDRHLQNHDGIRYECPHDGCGATFGNRSDCGRHIKKKHPERKAASRRL